MSFCWPRKRVKNKLSHKINCVHFTCILLHYLLRYANALIFFSTLASNLFISPLLFNLVLYVVAVSDTYRYNISDRYSILNEIATTLAFSSVNWCKIDVFTSNIVVLHHKISQTDKINVNRYINIYFLMNLFKINQFIFIFSCISALFSFIQQTNIFNHFVFLLFLIV